MTPAVAERPPLFRDRPRRFSSEEAPRHPLTRSDDGRLTLEQKLDRVWEGLAVAGAHTECPVCRSRITRDGNAATCGDCGTTLS